ICGEDGNENVSAFHYRLFCSVGGGRTCTLGANLAHSCGVAQQSRATAIRFTAAAGRPANTGGAGGYARSHYRALEDDGCGHTRFWHKSRTDIRWERQASL